MALGQLDIHVQKNKVRFLPQYTSVNLKWITDLDVRAKLFNF